MQVHPFAAWAGVIRASVDDLEHLLWACLLYSVPWTRSLGSEVCPISLQAWAGLYLSTPIVTGVELWGSLDKFPLNPAAPPTGARLLPLGHTA